jgi:hypothetical protein
LGSGKDSALTPHTFSQAGALSNLAGSKSFNEGDSSVKHSFNSTPQLERGFYSDQLMGNVNGHDSAFLNSDQHEDGSNGMYLYYLFELKNWALTSAFNLCRVSKENK